MDGSRRYSKIYCKTQAATEALTAGRGVLSSSARQLLILLDGQRDFDELARIFGEETLYRLLPFLESQGLVEPLNERSTATAQVETASPTTTTRIDITTALPVEPTVTPTVTQVVAPPATLSEPLPVQMAAKSPRFLAVPIAILVSLATAATIVNWVFEREQHPVENPQPAQEPAKPAVSAGNSAMPPQSSSGAAAPSTGIQRAKNEPSAVNSEPIHSPSSAALSLPPSVQSSPAQQASAPIGEASLPQPLRGKASPESSSSVPKPVTSAVIAKSNETNTGPAQRTRAESDLTADAPKQSTPTTRTQLAETGSRIAPRQKAVAESASVSAKGSPTQTDTSSVAQQGTLALAKPDHDTTQNPASAPAATGLHVRSRVLPSISKRALESGIYGGKAVVRLHVNSAGAVDRVELVSATPPEVYGPDVQQALEQWTFEPPSNPAQFTLELDFRQQPPTPSASASKPPDGP